MMMTLWSRKVNFMCAKEVQICVWGLTTFLATVHLYHTITSHAKVYLAAAITQAACILERRWIAA